KSAPVGLTWTPRSVRFWHGHGKEEAAARRLVDHRQRFAEEPGTPFLPATERTPGGAWLRPVRRAAVCGVLRGWRRPPEPAPRTLLPAAVARVLRRTGLGTGDRLACGGFAGDSKLSRAWPGRGGAGPLDDLSHAPIDRRGDAPRGL